MMSNPLRILVADDEDRIRKLVGDFLTRSGYTILEAADGGEALRLATTEPLPDLVILDVMMPVLDGWSVLSEIRRQNNVPVILLTAKSTENDQLGGFRLGADDYITKPFDGKEMTARVKAVLRRSRGSEEEQAGDLSFPGLTVSLKEYAAHYEGRRLEMPPKELEVLYFLASHPNQVFTREQLLNQVWGFEFFGDSRTVDVHIKRLREKLADSEKYGWSLYTVRGIGYKFATDR